MTVPADQGGGWAQSWHQALSAAELDIAETEALLERLHADADAVPDVPAPWQPPAGLGPLPTTEVERARALLARHQRLASDLAVAMTSNRQQRKVTASVAQRTAAAPIYVDTAL